MEENESIRLVYHKDKFMIVLGLQGVELSRAEAEQLFVDLGHALQDQDVRKKDDK